MLEKIGTAGFETLSKPDWVSLKRLDEILKTKDDPVIYEIGVGIGATTIEIAKRLDGRGRLVLFSRQSDIDDIMEDLAELGFDNVTGYGSANRTYSGYHFDMAVAFVEGALPRFDLAFLDGGHVMHLDGSTTCLLKELAAPGAYFVFDDIDWSLSLSPTMNPNVRKKTREDYDARQIETCQVDLVLQCFMDTDPRFEPLERKAGSAVYRRLALD